MIIVFLSLGQGRPRRETGPVWRGDVAGGESGGLSSPLIKKTKNIYYLDSSKKTGKKMNEGFFPVKMEVKQE